MTASTHTHARAASTTPPRAASTTPPRVAIVFGGSRGIGAAIARRLAADGFAVALTYVSRPDKAAAVVDDIVAAGGRALAIAADSADPAAIARAVDTAVAEFGELHAVVVNAGIFRHNRIDAVTVEELDLMLDVNLRGVFLSIQAAVARMHDGGRVITIGSNSAISHGTPGSSVYSMTKAAVAAMVRGVALDLAPRGIAVNNIQPGPVATDLTAEMIPDLIPRIPLRRVGAPEEIAELASYLANDRHGYMTGSSLTIDGGFVL